MTALLWFGFLARVLHLGAQSIWGDEAFTWVVTQAPDWFGTLARDVHPPLYFALITLWTKLAGTSEFALRVPSVLASLLSMALLFLLAREVLRQRPERTSMAVPPIAVLLFTLSDLEIMVAQDARSYTLHLIWVMLSILAYLRWLRTDSRRWLLGWIVSTTLIVYTHYIGVFTPLAVGLHALLFLRGRKRFIALGSLTVSALLVLPWGLGVVLPQQVGKFAGDVVQAYESNLETLWFLRKSWFTDQWALMLGLALVGLLGLHATKRGWSLRWKPWRGTALLLLWMVVPLLLAFLLNEWLPVLYDYRISQITPPIVLLLALGLGAFPREARAFFLVVIVIYGISTVEVYRQKPPWDEFGQMTARYLAPGDAILLDFTGGDYTMDYYLERHAPPGTPIESIWQWQTFRPQSYESGILGYVDGYDTVWLARWSSSDEAFIKLSATGHEATYRDTLLHLGNEFELYRFDRLAEGTVAHFANGMILRHAEVLPAAQRVDLWWTTQQTLNQDYTVSVKLFAPDGSLAAQQDAPPVRGTRPTTGWQVGETLYDPYDFSGQALPDAPLTVQIDLYRWQPDGIETILTLEGQNAVMIGQIQP